MPSIYAYPPLNSTANPRAVTPACPGASRDLVFERAVMRLHDLGPRAVCELLRQCGAETMRMTIIEARLADFAKLDPDVLRAFGGDRFARPPLSVVKSVDEEPAP